MNYEEIKQLRAYARYDGIYLAIVWTASFVCFLATPLHAIFSTFSSLLTLCTPFFVAYRFKVFRNEGLNGVISFKRGYVYSIRVFMNAALLFSFLQWAYMQFLDNGKVVGIISSIVSLPDYDAFFASFAMSSEEFIKALPEAFSPITMVSTSLFYELFIGAFLSLFIAAAMMRNYKK